MLPQVWHSVDGELPRSSLELVPQIVMRECLRPSGHVDECLLKALAPTCRVLGMVSGCGDSGEHTFYAADVVSTEKATWRPGKHPALGVIRGSKNRPDCQ